MILIYTDPENYICNHSNNTIIIDTNNGYVTSYQIKDIIGSYSSRF
jgi:hypothetical protein